MSIQHWDAGRQSEVSEQNNVLQISNDVPYQTYANQNAHAFLNFFRGNVLAVFSIIEFVQFFFVSIVLHSDLESVWGKERSDHSALGLAFCKEW